MPIKSKSARNVKSEYQKRVERGFRTLQLNIENDLFDALTALAVDDRRSRRNYIMKLLEQHVAETIPQSAQNVTQ